MRGYGPSSYGDGFADVYDDWYADVTDVDATVDRLVELVGSGGRVLELGVGTGRLAIPMALAGLAVTGVDSSRAMLDRLRAALAAARRADPPLALEPVEGDMVADLPHGPFDAALVAYNTIFNLIDEGAQERCFVEVASRLAPGGWFVVEAAVPDPELEGGRDVAVRSIAADRVVLTVTEHRPDESRTDGQFIELTEAGGVRLRPWSVRWASIAELDAMAAAAGFALDRRWSDMGGAPFREGDEQHVSVYRLAR